MSALPCPNCGADLSFLDRYQRHYCYRCQQYAPEGYGSRGEKPCPNCRGILSYVALYDRHFCYRCNAYPPLETKGPEAANPAEAPAAIPMAGPSAAEVSPRPAPETPAAGEPEKVPPSVAAEPRPAEPPEADEEKEERPRLVREEILESRKARLIDLCKAYNLEPGGTKDQLRERLLSYFEELEAESRPREPEPAPVQPAPTVELEGPEALAPVGLERLVESTPANVEPAPVALLVEEIPPTRPTEAAPEPVLEVEPEPIPGEVTPVEPEGPVPIPVTPTPPSEVEHPCPTCDRELDYITQYDRWYCHSCKAYPPRTRAFRHACPTCGTTLRWIEPYQRWWCDTERRYAPADLPGPAGAIPASPAAHTEKPAAAPALAQVALAPAHGHRSPRGGIGIAASGIALWFVYQLFVEIPRVTQIPISVTIPTDVSFLLQFFGFLFLGVGVLLGLAALKDRR